MEGGAENLLEWGPLHVQLYNHGIESQLTAEVSNRVGCAHRLVLSWIVTCHLQVGKVSWQLQTTMPTLRANPHTFMFAIPGGQTFYSVLIAASKYLLLST